MTDIPVIAEEPIGSPGGPTVTPFVIDITEDRLMEALGNFLQTITQFEVVRGQDNRVPQPSSLNFIVMTPSRRVQLSTTIHEEFPDEDRRDVSRSTRCDVQVDVYGPASTDAAQAVTTLLRDSFGCDFLFPYGVAPLSCDDGRQMPLVDGEKQYESRWMILTSLQINPAVSTPAQFADTVSPTLIEVA